MRIYEFGVVVTDSAAAPNGLRLVATDEMPIYSRYSLTLVDDQGGSLNERLAKVLTVSHAYRNADYYEETDARYALRACAYHVERLVAYYSENARLFEEHQREQIAHGRPNAISGNTDDQRVYFEIDAFLGSARRFYEQLRRVLWKHFGSRGTRPRSFDGVLQSAKLPEAYRSALEASWTEYGAKLSDYRDSVFHNDPLNEGHTSVWFVVKGTRWAMTVRLPENPEAKSRNQFRFEAGPDALSYCYQMLCHLTAIAEKTHTLLGMQ